MSRELPPWMARPEGGSLLALRLLRASGAVLGRRGLRLVLPAVTLYFFARRGPERRASRAYLTRMLGRPARFGEVLRHMHCFACTSLDRMFLLSERFRRFDVRASGLGELDRALAQGRGVLLVGSHLGNFDALRVIKLERPEVPIRILLDVEQNPGISTVLNELNPEMAATIINTRQAGPALTLAIKEALDRNAIVALLADRALPGQAVVPVQFLGAPAALPAAPWLLAAALAVPVVLSFGLYRGGNRYDLHFEAFADSVHIERRARAQALAHVVQRFADRLAHYARLAPYNWFNFYDFWQGDAHRDRGGAAADGGLVRRH